jgi:hypothetical protein
MRLPVAATLLVLSASPLLAADLCSGGFGNVPARLKPLASTTDYDLVLDNAAPERLTHLGSVGTGLNGSLYKGQSGKPEVMYSTDLWLDSNVQPEKKTDIILFRDRVFSPCEK